MSTVHAPTFAIASVRVHAVDLANTVTILAHWIERRQREYVLLAGAHWMVEVDRDPTLRNVSDGAGLVVPDGMPLVWLARARGLTAVRKVTGAPLMDALIRRGIGSGYRHFLYGGGPGLAALLAQRLAERHPGVVIAGTYSPPFGELEGERAAADARAINASNCDILWVGLGCPKQERWMARMRPHLDCPVLVGVGAAFDFLAGTKPNAPEWVRDSGFEWLFRLASEPRRLWPRYSRVIPRFLALAARDLARGARQT